MKKNSMLASLFRMPVDDPNDPACLASLAASALSGITYNIIDVNGRTVKYGLLSNYRITLKNIAAGVYSLRLYQNNQQIGKTKKIVKQ